MAETTIREAIIKLKVQPDEAPIKPPKSDKLREDIKKTREDIKKTTDEVKQHEKAVENTTKSSERQWGKAARSVGHLLDGLTALTGNTDLAAFAGGFDTVIRSVSQASVAAKAVNLLSNAMNNLKASSKAAGAAAVTSLGPVAITIGAIVGVLALLKASSEDTYQASITKTKEYKDSIDALLTSIQKLNETQAKQNEIESRRAVNARKEVDTRKELARIEEVRAKKEAHALQAFELIKARRGSEVSRQQTLREAKLTTPNPANINASNIGEFRKQEQGGQTQHRFNALKSEKAILDAQLEAYDQQAKVYEKIIAQNNRKIQQAKDELKLIEDQRKEEAAKLKLIEDQFKSAKQKFGALSATEQLDIQRAAAKPASQRTFEEKQLLAEFGPKAKQEYEAAAEKRADQAGFAGIAKATGATEQLSEARKKNREINKKLDAQESDLNQTISTLERVNDHARKNIKRILDAMEKTLKLIQEANERLDRYETFLEALNPEGASNL